MTLLQQAATLLPHQTVDWKSIAILCFGGWNTLLQWNQKQRAEQDEKVRQTVDQHSIILAEIVAQIGIKNGGGMAAQLKDLILEVKGLREDVYKAMIAIAKQEG